MPQSDIGMIGLGVMGQNLVLNLERNGYSVAVYERNPEKTKEYLHGSASGKKIFPASTISEMVSSLSCPRKIMLLVKAGSPVDSVLQQLAPLLEKGDLIIDGGNSFFLDTERRAKELAEYGIDYLGMGVSGGETGALWGPSFMPGGSERAYESVAEILQKTSAKAVEDGEPCVTYIGPGGSGHYVKMVHNGIEYGDMQLIAEAYDLLQRTIHLTAEDFQSIFAEWNRGKLASFLIEITAKLFAKTDEETGKPLLDLVLDQAGQKGTGKWTSQNALDLGVAIPTITAAVDARILSGFKAERVRASALLAGPKSPPKISDELAFIHAVGDALFASKISTYAQGMSLLKAASQEYRYKLNLASIAKIWRAGCIIRANLLNDISHAYLRESALSSLYLAEEFREVIAASQEGWRLAVKTAVEQGIPVPAMSASLAHYDSYRSGRLPANLIQAQRDLFGAHTFERTDKEGAFHANWLDS